MVRCHSPGVCRWCGATHPESVGGAVLQRGDVAGPPPLTVELTLLVPLVAQSDLVDRLVVAAVEAGRPVQQGPRGAQLGGSDCGRRLGPSLGLQPQRRAPLALGVLSLADVLAVVGGRDVLQP